MLGAIQVLRNAVEGGRGSDFTALRRVQFNVISVTREWVGVEL